MAGEHFHHLPQVTHRAAPSPARPRRIPSRSSVRSGVRPARRHVRHGPSRQSSVQGGIGPGLTPQLDAKHVHLVLALLLPVGPVILGEGRDRRDQPGPPQQERAGADRRVGRGGLGDHGGARRQQPPARVIVFVVSSGTRFMAMTIRSSRGLAQNLAIHAAAKAGSAGPRSAGRAGSAARELAALGLELGDGMTHAGHAWPRRRSAAATGRSGSGPRP